MTEDRRGKWLWKNLPVPEPHVIGLVASVALHLRRPWRIAENRGPHRAVGWLLIGTGVLGIGWAVRTIDGRDVEEPSALVVTGPYAFSRNPMYVAWTALYAGIGLLLNTVWPFVCLPAVLAMTHALVRREERSLARSFGAQYRDYRRRVPRYL